MIRHLLFKQPESMRTLRPGDWIAFFEGHKGRLDSPPLKTFPYIGYVDTWQATPDNAAEILRVVTDKYRQVVPAILILEPEFFQGGLYLRLEEGDYILGFRSVEVDEEMYQGLQEMAGEIEKTHSEFRRRGMDYHDPLAGLEQAAIWNIERHLETAR